MYAVDPKRMDLVEEYRSNPYGPHSPELALLVNRLRLIPIEERHIIVCTRRGREWVLGKMPADRGAPVELVAGAVFYEYAAAVWEVFRLRWQTVTGEAIDR
jgi:hypothetical protein